MTLENLKQETFTVDRIHAAIEGARVSRGKNKGLLKASKPKGDAGAAWLAMMLHANPHKVSPASIMMLTNGERWIHEQVWAALVGVPQNGLDRDRDALEGLGVW